MRKIKTFITMFVCLFLLTSVVACKEDEQKEQGSSIDLSGVTFESETKEFTGEPLAIIVKGFPGTVKVDYTYKNSNGEEVENMVEIGVYDITAVITEKATGKELKTLTAQLTIKEKTIIEEVKDKANAKIKLTFGTEYIEMVKNPADETQLIASGVNLWAREEIYFVLNDSDAPLNFITLNEESLPVASVVDNKLVISEAGSYNICMLFPSTQLQPQILVQPGEGANLYYFCSSDNEYTVSEETIINADEETNPVPYTIQLQAGTEFLIQNKYGSGFVYNKYFVGMEPFAAGSEKGRVKVVETGTYKFEINIQTKTLVIYKDGQLVEADKNPLYLKGTMNGWTDSVDYQLSKNKGIATITVSLNINDEFKVANPDWSLQYGLPYFSSASQYFSASTDEGNVKVLQAGTYKIEIDTNNNKVTVYYGEVKIIDNASAGGAGGNVGSEDATGTIAIYFSNNYRWEGEIYVYVWNKTTEDKPANWPGIKMTYVMTNGYGESIYTANVDIDKYDMIIFTNGSSQSSDAAIIKKTNVGYYVTDGGLGNYTYTGQ